MIENTAHIAGVGHNNPPPFDADALSKMEATARDFFDAGGEYLDAGEISDDDTAARLNDFMSGLRKVRKGADEARKQAKQPYLDAGKAVDSAYNRVIAPMDKLLDRLMPLATNWLRKKKAAQEAEAARQRDEARRTADEAARQAQQAAARNDIIGQTEAEEAMKMAAAMEKDADRAASARANIQSATGGARTTSLRTYYLVEIINIRAALIHFADRQAVADCIKQLAAADARSKDFNPKINKIPGINLIAEERAV